MLWLLIAFCVAFNLVALGAADQLGSEYDHYVALNPAQKMKLYWTVNKADQSISFALEAKTTGWVGLGFTPGTGRMLGADLVIGWVKDGTPYLTDHHGEGHFLPPMDESQDYKLISGYEKDGKTTLKFSRKLDTCDKNDQKLEDGTTRVIFAYSDEDPISANHIGIHTYKSAKSMLLMSYGKQSQPDPKWQKMEFLMNNITVPKRRTSYTCQAFRMPDLRGKKHIVRFEPVVEPGNEGLVHHLVVYECKNKLPAHLLNRTVECTDFANMPSEVTSCKWKGTMIAAWGVGAGPFHYPEHVGFPIGMDDSGSEVIVEIHYDNPELLRDRHDNSGVRFYLTSKLRQYDAGSLSVGADVSTWMVIPPKQHNWIVSGYCTKKCTQHILEKSRLPGKGIKIFSSFLHTHLAGRGIWTKHIRDGVQLPDIARDNYYDFNFQEVQRLPKEVHFKPGDEMIHQCNYSTLNRANTTFGGLETRNEMCINLMLYYPRLPSFKFCSSNSFIGPYKFLEKYFPKLKGHAQFWVNPLYYVKPKWTDQMVKDLKEFYRNDHRIKTECTTGNYSNFNHWLKPENLASKVIIKKPYVPPPSSCDVQSSSPALQLQASVLSLVCGMMLWATL